MFKNLHLKSHHSASLSDQEVVWRLLWCPKKFQLEWKSALPCAQGSAPRQMKIGVKRERAYQVDQ